MHLRQGYGIQGVQLRQGYGIQGMQLRQGYGIQGMQLRQGYGIQRRRRLWQRPFGKFMQGLNMLSPCMNFPGGSLRKHPFESLIIIVRQGFNIQRMQSLQGYGIRGRRLWLSSIGNMM